MKLNCCERCQIYWTCETKWYRGEKHEENVCCERCDYFRECLRRIKKKSASSLKAHRKQKAI